jgi:alkyldihydroxyacetonephosphate synthase
MVNAYENNFNDVVLQDLIAAIGTENVSTKFVDTLASCRGVCGFEWKWQMDAKFPYLPDVVVFPRNTEEVAAVIKVANKHKTVVIPYAGGSGGVLGSSFLNGGICLDVKFLHDIVIHEKDCTVTVGAGYNGEKLERDLNRAGFTHGHFPQSVHSSMPGGWLGPNAIGTFSSKYGKFDDMVISLEAVTPTGEIFYTSDSPKKSVGPNLNQLLIGSEGTLGVVTNITMRIWPFPEERAFEVYSMPSNVDGLEGIRTFIQKGVRPPVVRLYDEDESYERNKKWGYDPYSCFLLIGYDGTKEQVSLEKKICRECLEIKGGVWQANGSEVGWDWYKSSRFNTTGFLTLYKHPGATMESMEVSASWEKLPDVIRQMKNAMKSVSQIAYGHTSHVYHTGAMVYMIFVHITDGSPKDGVKAFYVSMKAALDACVKAGGTFAHHHGVGIVKSQWMRDEHNEGYEVMKKIKRALDPNNIMNPPVLGLGGAVNVEEII